MRSSLNRRCSSSVELEGCINRKLRVLPCVICSGILTFCSPIQQPENGPAVLKRIDNGWKFDPATRYVHTVIKPESYFAKLGEILNTDEAKDSVDQANSVNTVETEEDLFTALEPILEVEGGMFGFGKVIITRHRFHLFLRWCDQQGELLQ